MDGGGVSLQKAPGRWVWGHLPFPLLGAGPERVYIPGLPASLPVKPPPQRLPRLWGTVWVEGQLGRPWYASGSRQSAHVAAQLAQEGIRAVPQPPPRCLTLSSGWGLWETESGLHLPTEAWGPASPCPAPRASEEAPAQGTPAPSRETYLGKGSAPTHTHTSPV